MGAAPQRSGVRDHAPRWSRSCSCPPHLAQQYGLAILQGRERFLAFNILRTAPAAVYAAAVAVLLVLDLDGLGEVALAVDGGERGASALLTLTVALRGLGPGVEAAAPPVREMVAFGAKGLLGASSPIEYYRLDQAVVGLFLTPVALGIYAVALAFTNLPRFISTSVGMVAYPHVAAQSDPVEARRKLWRFFLLTVAACAGGRGGAGGLRRVAGAVLLRQRVRERGADSCGSCW